MGGHPPLTGITRFGDHRLEPPPSLRYVDRSMAQFNEESRELAVKVVYYGPALSGKTTNLQALYEKMDPKVRGRLMTLDTKDDRTLFFDMMPVRGGRPPTSGGPPPPSGAAGSAGATPGRPGRSRGW